MDESLPEYDERRLDEKTGEDLGSAELAVLGAVVETNGTCLEDLTLTGADFFEPKHGRFYEWMRRAHFSGKTITYPQLLDAFPDQAVFLTQLSEFGLLKYAVQDHAAIVAKHALSRRLRGVAVGIIDRIESGDLSEAELADEARSMVDAAIGEQRQPVQFLRDIVPELVNRMETVTQFVPTPWRTLDAVIGGFRPGAVYVFGARPSIGKSVLAAQCSVALARHGAVAFQSLEMSADELAARFVSERIGIHVGRVKDGKMTVADWERFAQRRRAVDDLQIAIDDRTGVTVLDVRQFARSVTRHGRLVGVVIDYLQLMSSDMPKSDRTAQVSAMSRQIKVMAKDLHVPVIVLSQLNRESEKRADPRPKLADLRESGAIEQDADVVVLLSREHANGQEKLILDVAKNRHGEQGVIELLWQGFLSRAIEFEDEENHR